MKYWIFFSLIQICVEQINEDGGNQNLRRDLLITLAETLISTYQFVDYAEKIHSPWDTEKILHLVSSWLLPLFDQSSS